jgi:hypothetical protein
VTALDKTADSCIAHSGACAMVNYELSALCFIRMEGPFPSHIAHSWFNVRCTSFLCNHVTSFSCALKDLSKAVTMCIFLKEG